MDLALYNLQRLICHKAQTNEQTNKQTYIVITINFESVDINQNNLLLYIYIYIYIFEEKIIHASVWSFNSFKIISPMLIERRKEF